jgi:hypothetical protein
MMVVVFFLSTETERQVGRALTGEICKTPLKGIGVGPLNVCQVATTWLRGIEVWIYFGSMRPLYSTVYYT